MKRRPTRRDLLIVVARPQNLVGRAMACNGDRNPNRSADVQGTLNAALELCIDALGQDPPLEKPNGPWAAGPDEFRRYT